MKISFPTVIEALDTEAFTRLPPDLATRIREFSSTARDLARERITLKISKPEKEEAEEIETVVTLRVELLRPQEDPLCPAKRIYRENPEAEPILQCRDDSAFGVFRELLPPEKRP